MTDARAANAATRPTKDFDVFVVYNDHDRAWVDGYLLVALRQVSARIATRADIQLGQSEVEGLGRLVQRSSWQVIVASPAWQADKLAHLSALLAQTHGQQTDTWPVIPVIIEEVKLPLWLSFLKGLEATDAASRKLAVDRLCKLIIGPVPPPTPPPRCPYPGMQPFDEDDAERFFGRDAEIEEAVQRLRLNPRLAVIGPSGSGKSSLVHAGLLPRLRHDDSQIMRLRPGPRPIDSLRTARAGIPDGDGSFVVVDQLEELFTVGMAQADEFCDEVERLASRPGCRLVVTMRADFYPQLMTSPLWPLLRDYRLELLPLGGDALRRAILGPAEKVEVFVESALVERLVADAAGEPGRLPLVQETLVLLWDRLERRYLPLSAYDRLANDALLMTATSYGVPPRTGLHIALSRHSDAALAGIPEASRPIARRILLRLVQFGDGRADTRRPQAKDALLSEGDDPDVFDSVLRSLTTARLVTMAGTESTQQPIADLSHESLITAWPTFAEWIEQRRVAEASRRRLEDKVGEWVRLGYGTGGLLDEVELVDAERYITGPDAADLGVSPNLRRLVTTSRVALEAERVRRARSARLFRRLAAALALLLVAALVLGVFAAQQRDDARAQRDEARTQQELARSGELALLALEGADESLGSALLLSREALAIRSTPRTRSTLLAALQLQPQVKHELWGGSPVQALASSPDRTRVAAGLRDGSVVVWDVASGTTLFDWQASAEPRSVAFSHDGRLVAVGSTDGAVAVWDTATGERAGSTLHDHSGSVRALSYSPDGRWLASGGDDRAVVLRPTASSGIPRRLEGHTDWVNALAFTPDSATIISGAGRSEGKSMDQRILAWPVDTRAGASKLGEHTDAVRALAISADGRFLASAGADGLVILWDLTTGEKRVLPGDTERLFAVAISPDGKLVASGGRDYDIRVWDTETNKLLDTLQGRRTAVRGLVFVDSTTLVSGANEATLRVWDLGGRTHPRLATPITGQAGAVTAVAVSGDGRVVATAAADSTVLVRDGAGNSVGADPIQLSVPARRLALSGNGMVLATISLHGRLELWDTDSGESLAGPVETHDYAAVVAITDDGQRVATGGSGSIVRLWNEDLTSDRTSPSGEGLGHRSWVTGLWFYPNGQSLASSGADGEVWIWGLPVGNIVGHRINHRVGQFTGLAVDTQAGTIAAGNRDGQVLVWRQPRLNPAAGADFVLDGLRDVGESPAPVTAVAFAADGRLAAVDENGAFVLWDTRSSPPQELGRTVALGERAHAVAFTAGGESLVTGADSGALLWDMSLRSWLEKACAVANRNLTPVELKTYLDEPKYRRTCPDLPDTLLQDEGRGSEADEGP